MKLSDINVRHLVKNRLGDTLAILLAGLAIGDDVLVDKHAYGLLEFAVVLE